MKKLFNRITDWQHWPFYLFYSPLSFAWVSYYIRSRSLWFFTSSNPTLAFGGFEGERKSEMYRQLPTHLCPKSIFINPSTPFEQVLKLVEDAQLQYPFIVKPDIGMKGILFRKIEREGQLEKYHNQMPADYIIQQFLDLPLEVSVFYYRTPGEGRGQITALIQKDLLEVMGDGKSTLGELIERHEDAKEMSADIKRQYDGQLERILQKNERFFLSHIANLLNGARFKNLKDRIDGKLLNVFDDISNRNGFHYGRYDIKAFSVEDIREGKNFYILEFNGAGSVPNHIYTGTHTLIEAYKEILLHWRLLYQASKINHQKGYRYWNLLKGYRFLQQSKKHFRRLKKLDKELLIN